MSLETHINVGVGAREALANGYSLKKFELLNGNSVEIELN
jgi:hypothetical protein